MPAINQPYPWGMDNAVNGPGSLTPEQKMWFVKQTVESGCSAPRLARRFDLNTHTVKQWVKTYRKRGILEGKPERSRLLDHQSMVSVNHYCRIHGYDDAPGLRDKIQTCSRAEMEKRGREIDYTSEDEEPPSKRTQGRYIALLKRDWAPRT
jgi:transposase-like protein